MDYVARRRASEVGLGDDRVVIQRIDVDDLHDKLYALEAAVEDVEADLADARTLADLRAACEHLLHAARPLATTRVTPDPG
jgi:hypothetical protein